MAEDASTRQLADTRREAIRERFPDLVREVRLRDAVSRTLRAEGWAPESCFAEVLLRNVETAHSPGERAALGHLTVFCLLALGSPERSPALCELRARPDAGRLERAGIGARLADVLVRRGTAGDTAGMGAALLEALAALRAQPLVATEIGWAHTREMVTRIHLFGSPSDPIGMLSGGLIRALDRAAMCLVGDGARPEALVGADEKGLVRHDLGHLDADAQAVYRYLAARSLPEVLNDTRPLAQDLPERPEQWPLMSPDQLERLLRQVVVDRDLLAFFEEEIRTRKRYEVTATTEVRIDAGGIRRIILTPPRPYARKLRPGGREGELPSRYLAVCLEWDDGRRDFATLIFAEGVGDTATQVESTLISAAPLLRSDGADLGLALRGLLTAVYRDLVVADVREGHYVTQAAPRPLGRSAQRRAAKAPERVRLLPRIVYEQRRREERRASGAPPEPRFIGPHIRRLAEGRSASERAQAQASEWRVVVPEGYTFVRPFYRPRRDDAEAQAELKRPVYRSWSAYDLLMGAWEDDAHPTR